MDDKATTRSVQSILLQGAGSAFLVRCLGVVSMLGVHVSLARILGPGEYGIYAYSYSYGAPVLSVTGNTLINNVDSGIYLRAYSTSYYGPVATINNNNIYGNGSYDLRTGSYRDARTTGEDIGAIMARGRRSCEFTKKLAEGRRVSLEFDTKKRDKYGRLLAHVFISDSRLFLNAEIIKQGYAEPMIIPPNLKYEEYFRNLYYEARKNKRGLWSND